MKNMKKKAMVLMVAASMAMTSLAGCGGFKNSDVVATVGDTNITADVVNFYARWQQMSIESMYGSEMWAYELSEGETYEDSIKVSAVDTLRQLYILEDHMEEYGVSLTADEEAAITESAKAFVEANSAEANALISADESVVTELLRLFTISAKMEDAMVADVDTEVSDEEAAQKAMLYVFFSYTSTDDEGNSVTLSEEEQATVKASAESFLVGAKEAKKFATYAEESGYEAIEATFDAESTTPDATLIAAADALEKGEFTDVIETEAGCYVAKVSSLLDRDATDAKKETIVSERQSERYTELYEAWETETAYELNEKMLTKIDFVKVGVSAPADETETEEEHVHTDDCEHEE